MNVATTKQILELNESAVDLGCRITSPDMLDPDGIHVLWRHFLHNDTDIRTIWLVKLEGQEHPQHAMIDVPISAFQALQDTDLTKAINDAKPKNIVPKPEQPRVVNREAWACEDCDDIFDEPLDVALYECSKCGFIFNRSIGLNPPSHRCPECNFYGRVVEEQSCPACNKGPVYQATAWGVEGSNLLFDDEESARKAAYGQIGTE